MESNDPQLVHAAQQLLDPETQPVFSELDLLAQQLEQYAADTLCKKDSDTNTSSSEFMPPVSSAHHVLERLQTTIKQYEIFTVKGNDGADFVRVCRISSQSKQYYASVSAFGKLIDKVSHIVR